MTLKRSARTRFCVAGLLLASLTSLAGVMTAAAAPPPPEDAGLPPVPGLEEDGPLRGGLERSRRKFLRDKTGIVAYVGGSITAAEGWTQLVDAELSRRFPDTKFRFTHAGIPSIDSTGHAFRFSRDAMAQGVPDLIFLEAAVNDLHNGRDEIERLRAVEGIVRRARELNPAVDLVLLHFADPRHLTDYEQGKTPAVIASHEQIAERYQLPSVNLAHEVQRRIRADQFEWARDFKDLHPSPFGHRLYYQAVRRLFDSAWPQSPGEPRERSLPAPRDPFNYDSGVLVSPSLADRLDGFALDRRWRPRDKAGIREGFVDVPMLIAERAGASCRLRFEGRAIGMFLAAGPDTALIEYRIDGGDWKRRDTQTQWSGGLHIPWALLLEAELPSAVHTLDLRIPEPADGRGTALRIRDFLVNGPTYDLPPLTEIRFASSIDGTEQAALVGRPKVAEAGSSPRPDSASRPAPLLVYLHSWSGDYRQNNAPWQAAASERGWVFLHPNFRGVNDHPEACGSALARQDILDAIEAVAAQGAIDRQRIYLAGTSGGGHMALLMAGYHPDRFSAVSAWVGISDLAEWYRFHVKNGREDHYAQMTVASLGGKPGDSPAIDAEYRARSPLFQLMRARDVPLDIAAGVTDGKTGSVPISHSLLAFNVVAKAQGQEEISAAEMAELREKEQLAAPRPSDQADDESLGRQVMLRREAGRSRVTIFNGGHEGLPRAACTWLERQLRPTHQP